jgi:PST family polysaccharide transporter
MLLKNIVDTVKRQMSNQFIRNAGWLTGAEFLNRVLRLGVVIILARLLSPYEYGLVAIILAINEFANVFTFRAGIGSKLVQASEIDLPVLCNTAYWMNWILGILLFIAQCLAAFPLAWFYGNNQIILPLIVLASVYLIFPIYAVQAALLQRENRLKITALCNALQALIGNAFTVAFAFMGMGLWAIILPIILTAPIWLIVNLINHPWRAKSSFTLNRWQEIASYASSILGVDLLNKLRTNIDYLLVGRFLGVEALGLYYFAFNAGLSITINILHNLTWSLFPYLCAVREDYTQLEQRYFKSVKKIAFLFVPIILVQTFLAPFYVPIIYGSKWADAIPVLMLICLSALPRPFADAAAMLLEAVGKIRINLYWSIFFTFIFSISILVSAQFGIFWVALTVLLTHVAFLPVFTILVNHHAFPRKSIPFIP